MLTSSLRSNGSSSAGVVTQPHHMRRVLTPLKSQPQPPPASPCHAQNATADETQAAVATLRMSNSFALQYQPLAPASVVAMPPMDQGPVKAKQGRSHHNQRSREALFQEVDALWHALSLMAPYLSADQLLDVRNRVSVDLTKWDILFGQPFMLQAQESSAAAFGEITTCESTSEFVKNDSFAAPPLTGKENIMGKSGTSVVHAASKSTARRVSFSCPDLPEVDSDKTFRPCTAGAGLALTSVECAFPGDSPAPLPPSNKGNDLVLEEATPLRRLDLSAEPAAAAPVTPVPVLCDTAAPFRRGGLRV